MKFRNSVLFGCIAILLCISNGYAIQVTPASTYTTAAKDSPLTAVSTPTAGIEALKYLNTATQARQNSTRGLSAGDIAFNDKHIWLTPFGIYTKQNNKDGLNGFSANTYGFGIGIDGEHNSAGGRVGLAFFYLNTDLNINNITQSNSVNTFNITAYGSSPVVDSKTMFFYQAGVGIHKNSAKRYVSQNTQAAKANYTSHSYYAQVKVTRDYIVNDKFIVTPSAKGMLAYFKAPAYSESGAGTYSLNVGGISATQVLFGFSTNMKYKINDKTSFISNVSLDYDFNNNANSVNAYHQGAPGVVYATSSIKNNALGYGLGLGISRKIKKNLLLDIQYGLDGRGSSFINHSIQAKFSWKF